MVNTERLVKKFLRLLNFNSPSGNEKEVALYCAKELKRLGLTVNLDKHFNIIAKKKGVGKPVLLSSHTDTVEPTVGQKVIFKNGVFKTDGKTILGSDDKAGLAVIFEILEIIKEYKLTTPPLEIVFTVQEESGLNGSQLLDYEKIKSKMGLVLDLGSHPGRCAIKAPAYVRLDIDVIGKAAHSAVSREGINALLIASEALSKIKLGDLDDLSCANFGVASCGVARNIVPDRVSLKGEVRSFNYKKAEEYAKKIINTFRKISKKHKGKISVSKKLEFKGYSFTLKDDVLKRFKEACGMSDIEFIPSPSKGGSDANIFNLHGIKVLDISVGNFNAHTVSEEIWLISLERSVKLVMDFLEVG